MQLALVVLLGLVALALFVGILFLASFAGASLRRALGFASVASRRSGPIGELASGDCTAHGFVKPPGEQPGPALLSSPITGRDCVFFELTATYMGRPCFSHREAVPCAISDGTGELSFEPTQAELVLENEATWRGFSAERVPPKMNESLGLRLAKKLSEVGATEGAPASATLELTERALHSGEPLYVSGTMMRVGPTLSLVAGRPVIASDRAFSELARRNALVALFGLVLALVMVSVVVSVGSRIFATLN